MLLVQDFLRNTGSLQDLENKYKIYNKRHNKYPNLVLLKYDQIESPFSEAIVRECRGLILNEANNWEIVAFPFTKFFNYGEPLAANIDWNTARVQEKLDGSLAVMFYYDHKWQVATSGTPDASGNVNGFDFTFEELFWKTFKEMGLKTPDDGYDIETTFMFELTTPYNKVVVQHKECKLTLIGTRDLVSYAEIPIRWDQDYPHVKEFPLQSIKDIEETFNKLNPLEQEGYVVLDANYNRVKVKHPGYVALHHLRDSVSPKRILEIIRSGESTEFLTYFPEFQDIFNSTKEKYNLLVKELEDDYSEIKDIKIQKEFALEAINSRCSAALFQLRSNKVSSVKQYLAEINIDHLMDLIEE
ncbi:MAG: 2'-5' RNA ligase [Elusimicrobia bacterium]|nr:2'-5' RNA ligase [Elusimicrobiota bacterium]